MSKLPREGTLQRAVDDALEAGPANCHTLNQRLPKEHRQILSNDLSRQCYLLVKRGLIKGKKPKGCIKMYARLDHDFPGIEGFVPVRNTQVHRRRGLKGRRVKP